MRLAQFLIPSVVERPFAGLFLFKARGHIKVCAHALAWSCNDFTTSQSKDNHGSRDHHGTEEQDEGNVLNVWKRLFDRTRRLVHDLTVFLFHAQGHRRWPSIRMLMTRICVAVGDLPT